MQKVMLNTTGYILQPICEKKNMEPLITPIRKVYYEPVYKNKKAINLFLRNGIKF